MSTFKIKTTLCALAMVTVSASAQAATQGTVTFNGELTTNTCEIDADSINRQVQLPTIATQTLARPGDTAGSKGFDLNVKNCPPGIQVAAHFEAIGSTGVDSITGNLINTFKATPSVPAAKNVQVRLYNSNEKQLKLGETGEFFTTDGTKGTATMRYYSGYYAEGATTVGKVYAQAAYTLAYK